MEIIRCVTYTLTCQSSATRLKSVKRWSCKQEGTLQKDVREKGRMIIQERVVGNTLKPHQSTENTFFLLHLLQK